MERSRDRLCTGFCGSGRAALSTDGGVTFSNTPFATTANDGYAQVSFPSGVQTNTARIMLKGKDNIFFDVTDKDFSLNSNASATPEVRADQHWTDGRGWPH